MHESQYIESQDATLADRKGNVNGAYRAYLDDPTDENYERLYEAVLKYAVKLANWVIPREGWRNHAALNAATSTLLELERFDPLRASFSTWAYMSLKRDLIDWQRKKDRRRENSLTDLEDRARYLEQWNSSWTETFGAIEDKIFLRKFVAALTEEEQALCRFMAGGESLAMMAERLGVSLATVKRRWDAIRDKGRAARVL